MKKVLHVFTVSMSIPFLEGLPKFLRQAGYELFIISADGEEGRSGSEHNAFSFFPLEMTRGVNLFKIVSCWFRLRKEIKEIKPDIVHGNTPIGGFLAMTAAFSLGIKNRVFTMHGLKYPSERGIKRILLKILEKLTVQLSKKTFVVSNGLREYAIKERIANAEKLIVINNGSVKGIDLDYSKSIRNNGRVFYEKKYSLESNKIRIGYFGRITEDKGIIELLQAMTILFRKYKDLELLLCGKEEMVSDNGRSVFSEFIKQKHVVFFGHVKFPLELMKCCDCTVLPTHREGFGLVNIEANSVGIPVITTDVMGCIDSIEDKKTGLFFHSGDVQDLVSKLQFLIDNSDTRERMGANGVSRVNLLFNRRDIWTELIHHYDLLTQEKEENK